MKIKNTDSTRSDVNPLYQKLNTAAKIFY